MRPHLCEGAIGSFLETVQAAIRSLPRFRVEGFTGVCDTVREGKTPIMQTSPNSVLVQGPQMLADRGRAFSGLPR